MSSHRTRSENYSGFTNEALAGTANHLNKAFGVLEFLLELAVGLLTCTSRQSLGLVGHNGMFILPVSVPSASFVHITSHTSPFVYLPGLEEYRSDLVNLNPM